MTLFPERDLVLVKYNHGVKAETQRPWAIVTLHDPETFEQLEVSLHRDQIPRVTELQAKQRYRVVIDINAGQKGNWTSATLMPPENVKKPA